MNNQIKYTKDNTMDILLDKFPDYQDHWLKYLKYWEDSEKSFFMDFCDILDYVVELIEKKEYSELPKIFDFIEELNVYGDEEVQYAVKLGFLEGLTNSSSHRPEELPYETYIALLGPNSRDFCRGLDKFWGTSTPGLWTEEEVESGVAPPWRKPYAEPPINTNRVGCPVCGHKSFYEDNFPGSNYICNNCEWVDDESQYSNPTLSQGENKVSLNEAKENFIRYGISDPDKCK